jgi:hypothetical protein
MRRGSQDLDNGLGRYVVGSKDNAGTSCGGVVGWDEGGPLPWRED